MSESQHSEHSGSHLPQEGDPSSIPNTENDASPGRNRRRVALAAGAAPVLFALMNRPLMAQGACAADSPSGHASANASGRRGDPEDLVCGRSPGYWGNAAGVQGASDEELNRPFKEVFGTIYHIQMQSDFFGVNVYSDDESSSTLTKDQLTLGDVVAGQRDSRFTDEGNLARAFVAAYMNAKRIDGYPLTESLVLEMWNEVDTRGHLMVSGQQWSKLQVKQYLESTYEGSADD
ncbi:hypothetical protein SAMN05421721_10128 [Ectothiorhodospira mobilis]|uniref:Uncharacterized protein n=1 Tax=Ectothiorhodospira mobilis TaxID=195064 RepID=A0A1I4P6L1_ECTMO|nr:hypothetical protein SAMN05421721_10128 [Ectothiorhodospira mobilis]